MSLTRDQVNFAQNLIFHPCARYVQPRTLSLYARNLNLHPCNLILQPRNWQLHTRDFFLHSYDSKLLGIVVDVADRGHLGSAQCRL
jgi:hypothetical protein